MKNKEQLFQELLAENKERIYRICCAYLYDREEVEDLFQDVLINIWNNLEQFRGEAKWSTWIYRITANTALLYNRKTKRKQRLFVRAEMYGDQAQADTQLNEKITIEKSLEQLNWCISQLPKQDRLIIGMLLEGMAYKAIAKVMGLTVSHLGVKINRIKGKLKQMMKKTNTYEY